MLDIIRDRRTIISMIAIPILVIPLLTTGVSWFAVKQVKKLMSKEAIVILQNGEKFPALYDALKKEERLRIIENVIDSSSAIEMLRDEAAQAIVVIPNHWSKELFALGTLPFDSIHILSMKTKEEAEFAVKRLRKKIEEVRTDYSKWLLTQKGIDETVLKPFLVSQIDVSTPSETSGKVIGMILPYMLILLTLTGAMYPAIDLTAGEKERGTLETLLISPATRTEIVLGKFSTILVVSMVTALLTIASITLTSSGVFFGIAEEVKSKLNLHIDATIIGTMILLILPLAATFSSLLMTLSLLAKSYKEAQSYVSPLIIITILPAMASMLPGVKSNLFYSIIPILNVSLLVKDAFTGSLDPLYLLVAFLSTILLAAISVRVCVVVFNKESVLFRI